MAANQPLALEGDREPGLGHCGALATAAQRLAKGPGPSHASEAAGERGRVVIHVPRSFYFNMQIRNDERDPSPEERLVMTERTERQIRTAVALVLPASDSWKVEVDTIPDDVALSRPAILPEYADSRHRFLEWGIVGGLGVGVIDSGDRGIVDSHGAPAGAAARARGQDAALSCRFRRHSPAPRSEFAS